MDKNRFYSESKSEEEKVQHDKWINARYYMTREEFIRLKHKFDEEGIEMNKRWQLDRRVPPKW